MSQFCRLLTGDCLAVMASIPDASVGMVLADLPYGITANRWDSIIPLEPLWMQYKRVCMPTAAIVLTASQPFTSVLLLSNVRDFRHEWIWRKDKGSNFANTIREPFKDHEHVLVFSRGKWTYNPQREQRTAGGLSRVMYDFQNKASSENYREFTRAGRRTQGDLRLPSSVQSFGVQHGMHPTQKPVDLFAYLIRTYSNPGDVVLDNCMGSGTTGLAALAEQRSFIGIDQDADYVELARQRLGLLATLKEATG